MQRSIVDLPEPDGPGDDHRRAAVDLEIDAVEHEVVAEALADAVELDQVPPLVRALHRRGLDRRARCTDCDRRPA